MIAVTLNFINVDAVVRGLREIPQNLLVGELPGEVKPTTPVEAVEVKAEKKPTPAKPAAASTPPTAPAAAAPEPKVESSESKPASVEYPVLQKAVFALAAKSREAATALVAEFGVKTFKELDPSKWADALAAVNAKLAEV